MPVEYAIYPSVPKSPVMSCIDFWKLFIFTRLLWYGDNFDTNVRIHDSHTFWKRDSEVPENFGFVSIEMPHFFSMSMYTSRHSLTKLGKYRASSMWFFWRAVVVENSDVLRALSMSVSLMILRFDIIADVTHPFISSMTICGKSSFCIIRMTCSSPLSYLYSLSTCFTQYSGKQPFIYCWPGKSIYLILRTVSDLKLGVDKSRKNSSKSSTDSRRKECKNMVGGALAESLITMIFLYNVMVEDY